MPQEQKRSEERSQDQEETQAPQDMEETGQEIEDKLDELDDLIDEALGEHEENSEQLAQEFVDGFKQKGGE